MLKKKKKETQGVMPTCSHHQMVPVRVPPSSPPPRNCSHVRLCRNPSRPEIFQEFASEPQVRCLLFRCGVSPYPGTLATDTFRSTRQRGLPSAGPPKVGSVAFHCDTRGLLLAFFGWNGATAILGYPPHCDVACLHAADGGNAFFSCVED